jgi:hypothetical protein
MTREIVDTYSNDWRLDAAGAISVRPAASGQRPAQRGRTGCAHWSEPHQRYFFDDRVFALK